MSSECTVIIALHQYLFTVTFVHLSKNHWAVRLGLQNETTEDSDSSPCLKSKEKHVLVSCQCFEETYIAYAMYVWPQTHNLPTLPESWDWKPVPPCVVLTVLHMISQSGCCVPSSLPEFSIICVISHRIRYCPHLTDEEIELQRT